MIERLYLRDLLGFAELELEFKQGLVVFSGPSGAGKSVLMQALLSNLGLAAPEAGLCEMQVIRPSGMDSEMYELDDTLTIRSIKKERSAFYLDNQKISRVALGEIFAPYVHYLSVRDKAGLQSDMLVRLLDRSRMSRSKEFAAMVDEYEKRYELYMEKKSELEEILLSEKKLSELKEFARFEIDRISSVEPREGEYEELMQIKKRLSRLDRINEALDRASAVFEMEESVQELFSLLERDGSYFSDAMNQLRADFEEAGSLAEELSDIDVESVLDRLEKISSLISRYGSVSEALEYREKKLLELEKYENIEHDKDELERFIDEEASILQSLGARISSERKEEALSLEKKLSPRLESLKLSALKFVFSETMLGRNGIDSVDISLEGSAVSTLSGGEFNRLRLALMSVALEGKKEQGVVFLDEIDANVSGDESIAIAEMISSLSKTYQIFAVSHQPHLSSRAQQHILVKKSAGVSRAETLDDEGRIREISRIVGGEKPDEEALAFARKLIRNGEKEMDA